MWSIRPITKDDLPRAVELITRVFENDVATFFAEEGIETFTLTSPRDNLKGYEDGHIFLVAVEGDTILGVLRMNPNGHLHTLFVESSEQGQGIGSALVKAGLAELRVRRPDIAKITLVATKNAVDTYKHWGWVETGVEVSIKGVRGTPMVLHIDTATK